MASGNRTRFANAGSAEIAYQVLSDGPIDILLLTGAVIPIECMDEEPSMIRFQRRLSLFGRLIRFDKQGVGLSDRSTPSTPPTREQWVEDTIAVLDALGSRQAVTIAPYIDSPTGLLLAATYPERVSDLIIINGTARLRWAPDYPNWSEKRPCRLGPANGSRSGRLPTRF